MKTKNPSIPVLTLISLLSAVGVSAQVAAPGAASAAPAAPVSTTPAPDVSTVPSTPNTATAPTAVNPSLPPIAPVADPNTRAASATGATTANTASSSMTGTTNPSVQARSTNNAATATDAVNSSLAGSAAIQGDVRSTNRTMNPTVGNGQINGLATGAELSSVAAAALNPAETVRAIHNATLSSREALSTQVNRRIENTGPVISDLNRQASQLKGDARTQFKAAADDLRDREKSLKHSLNGVRKASNDTWSDAQARLAADYEAYATAVARAQAAATVNPASSPTPR